MFARHLLTCCHILKPWLLSTDNQTRRECVTKARLGRRLAKSSFAVKRQSGVTQGCHISQARKETGRSQKHPRRSQLIQDQSTRVQSVGLCCLVARYGGLEQYNRVQSVPWCCLVAFCSSLEAWNSSTGAECCDLVVCMQARGGISQHSRSDHFTKASGAVAHTCIASVKHCSWHCWTNRL